MRNVYGPETEEGVWRIRSNQEIWLMIITDQTRPAKETKEVSAGRRKDK